MQGITDEARLRELLSAVKRPSRYIGGEWGSGPVKEDAEVRICYAFPDLYEVGMSYLGFQILYALTKSVPYADAERVYAPWPDMERAMRESGTPIWALESKRGLRDFDAVGFTLQYELSYTNILTILDLAGIPFGAARRGLPADTRGRAGRSDAGTARALRRRLPRRRRRGADTRRARSSARYEGRKARGQTRGARENRGRLRAAVL